MDRYEEIKSYVEAQIKIFRAMPLQSDFNNGIIEGLNLVKAYLEARIGDEGTKIAEALDVKSTG